MKTNKSFSKRLKVTKNGKIISRATGQNHFNSREHTRAKARKHRMFDFAMTNKAKSRYLSGM